MLTRKTYNAEEIAEIFGISRNAAYTAIRRGEIQSVRFGRRVVVPCSVVEAMLGIDSHSNETPEPAALPISDAR